MKKEKYLIIIFILLAGISCTELDLVPLDSPTSAPFVSRQQFREGLNEGYRDTWFPLDRDALGADDDSNYRFNLISIKAGTLEANNGGIRTKWANLYKGIARMLAVKQQILDQNGILSDTEVEIFIGEADFFLASFWSYMITHFGDVAFYEKTLSVEEAFEAGRTDKTVILQKVYEYYDNAIAKLPVSYGGQQFATKGAAMAMKARVALYMGDYATAAEAAEAVMDLGEYDLHPSFSELFLSETKTSDELIFYLPRSEELNRIRGNEVRLLPRNVPGGWGGRGPSWELLAAFECTDGLPIDESPLFDRENPFKNRDPRCTATIVPFGSLQDGDGLLPTDGSEHLGFEYTSHPERIEVMNITTGEMIKNNDTKSNNQFANFHGLLFKKGIAEDWIDRRADPNYIVMRYADVLLMYAEAKIELNQIDAAVLDAINQVRIRGYAGSGITAPLITTTDQVELRKKVRLERRVELVDEGHRYLDLVRWRLAEKALSRPLVGLLSDGSLFSTDPVTGAVTVKPGLWFWSQVPEIDEDGIADFQPLIDAGFASAIAEMNYPARQYLFPVPSEDIILAPALLPNNDGY